MHDQTLKKRKENGRSTILISTIHDMAYSFSRQNTLHWPFKIFDTLWWN